MTRAEEIRAIAIQAATTLIGDDVRYTENQVIALGHTAIKVAKVFEQYIIKGI